MENQTNDFGYVRARISEERRAMNEEERGDEVVMMFEGQKSQSEEKMLIMVGLPFAPRWRFSTSLAIQLPYSRRYIITANPRLDPGPGLLRLRDTSPGTLHEGKVTYISTELKVSIPRIPLGRNKFRVG